MPRVKHVKKARKDQGNCRVCHKPIVAGDSYKWFQKMHASKTKACTTCVFYPSMLSGAKYAVIHDAIMDADLSDCKTEEDVRAVLEPIAEQATEVAEEYQESYDNMEENFPNGCPVMEEIEEYREGCEAYAEELESWDADETPDDMEKDDGETDEEFKERQETAAVEDMIASAQDALDGFQL